MKPRVCELCNGKASLYCESDSAFLCFDCDRTVHEANFLVARHVRRIVCCRCDRFDGDGVSGVGFCPVRSICQACAEEEDDSCSSASSLLSTCISTAESVTHSPRQYKLAVNSGGVGRIVRTGSESEISSEGWLGRKESAGRIHASSVRERNLQARAGGILVMWGRRMGVRDVRCWALALHLFRFCLRKFTILPFRVCLASSLWWSVKACRTRGSGSTWQLKMLEECSRVPSKLILRVESKLSRMLKLRRSDRDEKEGWAECSD